MHDNFVCMSHFTRLVSNFLIPITIVIIIIIIITQNTEQCVR